MIDIKFIRTQTDEAKRKLGRRGIKPEVIDHLVELDAQRRGYVTKVGELQNQRNQISAEIGKRKKAGEDVSAIAAQVGDIKKQIATMEEDRVKAEEELLHIIELLPNFPDDSVPDGLDDTNNRVVRTWGEIKELDFEPKPHWDLGTELGIFDFERATKLAGTRFWTLLGVGARLERALIAYMLDLHCLHQGYTEVIPPVLANRDTMYATGQLPKFAEDVFHIETNDMFLISTAEIPLTNLHRGEILDAAQLPIKYTGFTPCFRSEAGAAGRDTRGLVRVHQFHKVEMVKFSLPENSFDELEKMTADAESVLQGLKIPYRVMQLSAGDMSLSSTMTYDLEFWSPAQKRWIEISSCSNCTDFQARRGNIRFRRGNNGPTEYVHTLNGSGLAVGRTMVAIMENYQQADGTVVVPEVLRPYLGGLEVITKRV